MDHRVIFDGSGDRSSNSHLSLVSASHHVRTPAGDSALTSQW
jgi:hypothetical protein